MGAIQLAYDLYETKETSSDLCPIILMHGALWNKFMFSELAQKLCNNTNRKVYSLDLRNHGESPFTSDCDIYLMRDDVLKFLEDKNLEKIAFVCHSFSTTVAYLVTIAKPEVVEKFVMIDNGPFSEYGENFSDGNLFLQIDQQNKLLERLDPKMSLEDAREKFLHLARLGSSSQKLFYEKAAYDLMKENGTFTWKINMNFLMYKYRQRKFRSEPKGSSDHEVLIIRCFNSSRVPDSNLPLIMKHIPRAKIVTFEDTGHLLMFEKTDDFLQVVKEFLSS